MTRGEELLKVLEVVDNDAASSIQSKAWTENGLALILPTSVSASLLRCVGLPKSVDERAGYASVIAEIRHKSF